MISAFVPSLGARSPSNVNSPWLYFNSTFIVFAFSVHLKIHMPDIVQKHRHVKTKYIHVYHPKVIHTDHSSLQFLHARNDPNIGLINGGYPQPLINYNKAQPELRITEEEFLKWRQEQLRKAADQRTRHQEDQQHNQEDEDKDNVDANEAVDDEKYTQDLFKKHKANKANSSTYQRDAVKHRNHNYNQDYEASNSDKAYANYPNRSTKKRKTPKPSQAVHHAAERPRKTKPKPYGFVSQQFAEPSNVELKFSDPTDLDPTYYTTLPKDQNGAASDNQDEIYSGLLSARYNKKTADKSRLLADINYNRKQQTKIFTNKRAQ